MSAIFGFLMKNTVPASEDDLRFMAAAVRERGPDGTGLYVDGAVGLGLVRLHTGDGPEPIEFETRPPVIVAANARIDNHAQLIGMLGLSEPCSATALIARAHRIWGSDAPERLVGSYAYAAWDRELQRLTVVRDRMGTRPMYVASTDAFTAFASDPRSLLALPGVSHDLDSVGVFKFLFSNLILEDSEVTCFSAIKRLPAATLLEVDMAGHSSRRTYWTLDPEYELKLTSDEEYVDGLRERFVKAVARCLPRDGEVGATLSGGLDSSSITCVAATLLQDQERSPLHTFSAVFPETPEADESVYIRAVNAHQPTVAHEYTPGERSPFADLPQAWKSAIQPINAPNTFIGSGTCRAARDANLRVVLDGMDGDTTVGHGFDRFYLQIAHHHWSEFCADVGEMLPRWTGQRLVSTASMTHNFVMPEFRRLASLGRWPELLRGVHQVGSGLGLSRKNLLLAAWRERGLVSRSLANVSFLNRDFLREVQGLEMLADFESRRAEPKFGRRSAQHQSLVSGGLPVGMEILDSIGAAYQIEYRYPFCDSELVEYCLAVPDRFQLFDGWSRWIMRAAMEGFLPDSVRWRGGKTDLTSVHHRAMLRFDRDRFAALLENPQMDVLRFFDLQGLQKARDAFESSGDASSRQILWLFSAFSIWLDSFCRNSS